MIKLLYRKVGLTLSHDNMNNLAFVIDLRRHLRALGYLGSGIDGQFGKMTESRCASYDLLNNNGAGPDGPA